MKPTASSISRIKASKAPRTKKQAQKFNMPDNDSGVKLQHPMRIETFEIQNSEAATGRFISTRRQQS
jgi:hypothetical protein